MNRFALEIWDDETEKVAFYTVRWEDALETEVDKFFIKMNAIPEMQLHIQRLAKLITEVIGNTYGANEAFFNRFENKATALPPKGKIKISELMLDYDGFPLRLYCLALSEELVVLFNGGIKDARTAQESTDSISMKFFEANEFTTRIFNALNTNEIEIQGKMIVDYRGSTEIIL